MNIASRLKQARKSKGYTQNSLAHAIGVSRGVISNIEYGKTKPQALIAQAICNTLCINEQWLISGEGQMERSSVLEKRTQLLSEIYTLVKEFSENEQNYILDMIKTFQKHHEHISNTKES